MLETFVSKRFNKKSEGLIYQANRIIAEYQTDGFTLTLRQLYYQFVARDIIPNTMRSYKNLGMLINNARLAGLIDWSAIEDRTRNLRGIRHFDSGEDALHQAAENFAMDKWRDQPHRIEVWVEKDALVGVIQRVATRFDVDYFACRGYVSQSEQYDAGKRMRYYIRRGQKPVILHLGDHDPSGIDMTRDNRERIDMFSGYGDLPGFGAEVKRIALNYDQVETYNPPPNPAKFTDSRYGGYVTEYGTESWELDALEPNVLAELIERHILTYRDEEKWAAAVEEEEQQRGRIEEMADEWDEKREEE